MVASLRKQGGFSLTTEKETMLLIGYIVGSLYLLCMVAMSLYGLNAMVTAILFIRTKRSLKQEKSISEPEGMAEGDRPASRLEREVLA